MRIFIQKEGLKRMEVKNKIVRIPNDVTKVNDWIQDASRRKTKSRG